MKYVYLLIILVLSIACEKQLQEDVWQRQIVEGDKILAFIYEEDGKQGLLDTNRKVLLKAQFDYIEDWVVDGLIRVDSGGRKINGGDYVGYNFNQYGIITPDGKVLFRPQFDAAAIEDRTVLVKKDSLWGYVDDKGRWLMEPQFRNAAPFYKGTAIVEQEGKLYLINKRKELVNPAHFDSIWGFRNDVSVVQKGKQYGYIHYSGKLILPLEDYSGIGDFNEYHGKFRKDDKWFVIDTAGKLPFDYGFDEIEIIKENQKIYAEGKVSGKTKKIELE